MINLVITVKQNQLFDKLTTIKMQTLCNFETYENDFNKNTISIVNDSDITDSFNSTDRKYKISSKSNFCKVIVNIKSHPNRISFEVSHCII